MTREAGRTQMCAYCGRWRPYTVEHFPVHYFAECSDCIVARSEPYWPRLFRRFLRWVAGKDAA